RERRPIDQQYGGAASGQAVGRERPGGAGPHHRHVPPSRRYRAEQRPALPPRVQGAQAPSPPPPETSALAPCILSQSTPYFPLSPRRRPPPPPPPGRAPPPGPLLPPPPPAPPRPSLFLRSHVMTAAAPSRKRRIETATERPPDAPPARDFIPAELLARDQWVA